MPQNTQTITVEGYDSATLIAVVYKTFESLNWTIKYAVEKTIVAYTPGNWKKYGNEITAETGEEQISVTSKMIHGETFDMMGKNKKLINEFLTEFETVKNTATEENTNAWKEKIALLQQETIKIAEEETKQAAEVDKAMNLSGSNMYLTYGIMGINAIVFVLMCISGVSLFAPTGIDIIKWGGNHPSFTLSGDWWRLVSCVFVHIGIIHIVFNMYALFMIGVYLEPMLGKARFISAYLATGICASLASLWWHKEPITSAGASGAIFGRYGVFLALLSTNLIPKLVRNQLLKSIAIFIGYNLIYGMKSGVDNAAHIGGLLSGLIIGYIFYLGWKGENAEKKKIILALGVMIVTAGAAHFYLEGNKVTNFERKQLKSVIKGMEYTDGSKLMENIEKFGNIENRALAPLQDTTLTEDQLVIQIDQTSLPEWSSAEALINNMKTYDVSDIDKKKINLLDEYVQLRIEQAGRIKVYIREKTPEKDGLLKETSQKIEDIIERLRHL